MADGKEVREVVQQASPSGAANQPARQLGLVNIVSPRGGSTRAVGNEFRALAEISKIATNEFDQYIKRKHDEDIIQGGMDAVQGKTEADLAAAGVSQSHLDGYHTMNAKTGYNEWYIQTAKNIELSDHTMSTEDYKQQLGEQSSVMLERLGRNDVAREALKGLMMDGHQKLVAQHVEQSAAWRTQQNERSAEQLLMSESLTGDVDQLNELVDNFDKVTPGMSDTRRSAIKTSAVRQMLNDGSFALFDSVGGIDGLRRDGASEQEINSVRHALKSAQTQQVAAHYGAIDAEVDALIAEVKEGLSGAEAVERLERMQDTYRLTDVFMKGLFHQVDDTADRVAETEAMNAARDNPEYIEDRAINLFQLEQDGDLGAFQSRNKAIAAAYDIPASMVRSDMDAAVRVKERHTQGVLDKVRTANKEAEKQRALDSKAATLNSNWGAIESYKKEEISRAAKMRLNSIITSVEQEAETQRAQSQELDSGEFPLNTDEKKLQEITRRHVDFLKKTPIKDADVAQTFKVTAQSSPLLDDGTLDIQHLTAFQYIDSMKAAGMSERQIKDYAGDSYEYMSVAHNLADGTTDPKASLVAAFEATQVPTDLRPNPQPVIKDVVARWNDVGREAFFENIEPNIMQSIVNAASDGDYDDVLTDDVNRAMQDSPEFDSWFQSRVSAIATAYPNMNANAVYEMSVRDLSRVSYVNGRIQIPKGGQTMAEAMGLEDQPYSLIETTAWVAFTNAHKEDLFPEGTPEREQWEHIIDADVTFRDEVHGKMGDAINNLLFEPSVMTKLIQHAEIPTELVPGVGLFSFFEERQRRLNGIPNVDYILLSNGMTAIQLYEDSSRTKPVGTPVTIPARLAGNWWKQQRVNELRAKTPKR